MPVAEIGDPRLQSLFGGADPRDAGVTPVVRLPRKGMPPLILACTACAAAAVLFMVLNGRRTASTQPSVAAPANLESSGWTAPPPLYIPPDLTTEQQAYPVAQPNAVAPGVTVTRPIVVTPPAPIPQRRTEPAYVAPMPLPPASAPMPPQVQAPPRTSSGPPLVIDNATGAANPAAGTAAASGRAGGAAGLRVRASALANRATTVVQGTVLQAVLETGFDSTTPGNARAVVSRDVRSFDGTNIVIPRGSKLIGQYKSDVAQGQKRAVITWTRLTRPDGMTIAIDSPAVDTLGRGGVGASVNTHFLARLGDALLQSTIGIGSALAQRRIAGPVLVLPQNAAGAVTSSTASNNYVPTLTVPAGKSINVFVAHDLDFGTAVGRP